MNLSRKPNRTVTPALEVCPLDQHLTPTDLARAWKVDESTIRRLFVDEVGVLKLSTNHRGKRAYTTLRIPLSVAERVYRERSR